MSISQLPTGTVTFLFTDIEGSTRLLEEHGDLYQSLDQTQFDIIAGAIENFGGVVVQREGDAVFAAFSSAIDAVKAAAEAQLGLVLHTWPDDVVLRVRMGLHSGLGTLGGENYIGLDVHRTSRLANAAHGGQVVVSESTHSLVREDLPEEISFLDLGPHRFKDLSRTERAYQLLHPELPVEFPPLRSLEGFPNNLPAQLSTFLGREKTLESVMDAVTGSRLVTLMGPGGVGKTRLALQVAVERISKHPDGVWLIGLGGLGDPDLVAQTARSALGIHEQTGRPAIETLTGFLVRSEALLLLDNCEHLIEAAANLVQTLLSGAPRVRVLATSREPLNVGGEVTWPVPPMSLPQSDESVDLANPPEAVALFVERAQATDPGFELNEPNAPAVAAICRHLDGLPLAIELAAARVRSLSVDDIANRLEDRFTVLSAGSRTALPHHQTLEATVAWSYDLLDTPERTLFSRLAVFAGAFELSAAEAVGGGGDIESSQILDLLTGLVDKSLLTVVRDEQTVRYRMLETIRDYARLRMIEAAEEPVIEEAHTRWALGFAEQLRAQVVGPEMRKWLRRTRANFDDLRAVIDRAIELEDAETGLRLLANLEAYLVGDAVREGAYWLDQLLAVGEVGPDVMAPALSLHGELKAFLGEGEPAVRELEKSLELFKMVDDPTREAFARLILGVALWQSKPERVRQLLASALEPLRAGKDLAGVIRCLFGLAMWELQFGDPANAAQFSSQMEALGMESGVPLIKAHAAETMALEAHFAGNDDQARKLFVEAIAHHRQADFIQCLAHCVEHVALWSLDNGDAERSAVLLGSVETLRDEFVGTAVPPFERIWHDQVTAGARTGLGPSDFETLFETGRNMDLDAAVELTSATLVGDGSAFSI